MTDVTSINNKNSSLETEKKSLLCRLDVLYKSVDACNEMYKDAQQNLRQIQEKQESNAVYIKYLLERLIGIMNQEEIFEQKITKRQEHEANE